MDYDTLTAASFCNTDEMWKFIRQSDGTFCIKGYEKNMYLSWSGGYARVLPWCDADEKWELVDRSGNTALKAHGREWYLDMGWTFWEGYHAKIVSHPIFWHIW